jgi:hypothetical protein
LPGPASRTTPEQRQIAQLEKDKARLTRTLQIAEDCLGLQKKVLAMLEFTKTENDA